MKKTIVAIIGMCVTLGINAQPANSRVTTNGNTNAQQAGVTKNTGVTRQTSSNNAAAPTVSRFSIMFPTAVEVPEDAVWRRDIYRELDLTKDENAPLYYPVTPQAGRVNLFTLLFQLLIRNRITGYNYTDEMVENFSNSNRIENFREILERYDIPYRPNGNTISVDPIDVPSNEVRSYYIKESYYYNQHTATYRSRVVAICPILHRAGGFIDFNDPNMSADVHKSPLFWVKMSDIENYLSQYMVMTSNINNAATMSMADFFETNKYKGDIYMTTNMQGKIFSQTATPDIFDENIDPEAAARQSANAKANEQKRIEKELTDFEKHLWSTPVDSAKIAERDSIAAAQASSRKAQKAVSTRTTARNSEKAESTKKEKAPSSSSSTPRVSVRRQRR